MNCDLYFRINKIAFQYLFNQSNTYTAFQNMQNDTENVILFLSLIKIIISFNDLT